MASVTYPVRRDEVGGIPVYWAEQPEGLPVVATLMFRVGRADERLPHAGITHLVEHLALPTDVDESVEFNGVVDGTTTVFWARGDEADVVAFIAAVARDLGELPVSRLERERSILETEASSRGIGHPGGAMGLRYGARGHGTVALDEVGLPALSADDVTAWAARFFTRGNCALAIAGSLPADFELDLADGARIAPPEPTPIEYVPFPSVFRHGPDGSVAAAVELARSPAFMVAASVLERRVRDRLRHRQGLS
jgi:zinc protease